eukprot:TRINITY_DN6539_c0_g1_i1.p1 TRINITY_DN6539_c0_g1~~TRINITY_DN6539_c0_g1_i1.p1  ORF type:complete len:549 (+),score=134.74 TRINITY_DN6539_c0_g1_i1:160-1806(+)
MGLYFGLLLVVVSVALLSYWFGIATYGTWDTRVYQELSRKRRKQEALNFAATGAKHPQQEAMLNIEIEDLPKPSPYLGHIALLQGKYHLAHQEIARKYGRYVPLYFARKPTLILTDLEVAKEICQDCFDNFQNRPDIIQLKTGLVFAKGSLWRRLRRTISPTFSLSRLRPMTDIINQKARMMCQRLDEGLTDASRSPNCEVDIHDLMNRLALDVIGEAAFATRLDALSADGEGSVLLPHIRYLFDLTQNRFDPKTQLIAQLLPLSVRKLMVKFKPKLIEGMRLIENHALKVIQERRAEHSKNGVPETPKDFLDLLLIANDQETGKFLSDEEIKDQCATFLLAGSDTTSNTLAYAVYLLAQHPDVEQKLVNEINKLLGDKIKSNSVSFDDLKQLPYLDAVLKETLRYFPPAAIVARVCQSDIVLPKSGIFVPKGAEVFVPIWAVHRDPVFWHNPDEFNPDRFIEFAKTVRGGTEGGTEITPPAYIPFGIGPRACVGMKLAQMEAKLVLASIVYNYRFELSRSEQRLPNLTIRAGPVSYTHLTLPTILRV